MLSSEDDCGSIYFIGNAMDGPIKIGFTSDSNPVRRLAQLQTASPDELRVMGLVHGHKSLERKIHAFIDLHCIRGEWFERKPALTMLDHLSHGERQRSEEFRDQLTYLAFVLNGKMLKADPENDDEDEDDGEEPLAVSFAQDILLDTASRLHCCKSEKPLPLLAWLSRQTDRDDAIGDLAKDSKDDEDFPLVGTFAEYIAYTMDVTASPSVTRTMQDAWIECQQAILHLQ